MKYRKRVKLLPGVTLNISKSGFSTTVGVRGASVNMGRNGAFLNTGIPGTGIYDRKKINFSKGQTKPQRVKSMPRQVVFETESASPRASYKLTPGNRQSSDLTSLTPTEMRPLLEQLRLHLRQRDELKKEYEKLFLEEVKARRLEKVSKWLIYGWFYKGHAEKISEINALRKEVLEDWGNTHFSIDSNICEETKSEYQLLVDAYEQFVRTHKVWDIISQFPNQGGCYDFERQEIKLEAQTFEGVEREIPPLFFKNTFGTCLYIYQEFILIMRIKG